MRIVWTVIYLILKKNKYPERNEVNNGPCQENINDDSEIDNKWLRGSDKKSKGSKKSNILPKECSRWS